MNSVTHREVWCKILKLNDVSERDTCIVYYNDAGEKHELESHTRSTHDKFEVK